MDRMDRLGVVNNGTGMNIVMKWDSTKRQRDLAKEFHPKATIEIEKLYNSTLSISDDGTMNLRTITYDILSLEEGSYICNTENAKNIKLWKKYIDMSIKQVNPNSRNNMYSTNHWEAWSTCKKDRDKRLEELKKIGIELLTKRLANTKNSLTELM